MLGAIFFSKLGEICLGHDAAAARRSIVRTRLFERSRNPDVKPPPDHLAKALLDSPVLPYHTHGIKFRLVLESSYGW